MVYLLHFEKPFYHAQHYIGYCSSEGLDARMERHKRGQGARLLKAVHDADIQWEVAYVWDDGTHAFERILKNKKNTARFCPICKGTHIPAEKLNHYSLA